MTNDIEEFDGEAITTVLKGHAITAERSNQIASDGHFSRADKATLPPPSARNPISDTIDAIRAYHRERNFAMEQRKRIDLALGSYLRMALGWRKDMEDSARKSIADVAKSLVECGEAVAKADRKGKEATHNLADTEEFLRFKSTIMAALKSREPWDAVEADATKAMERLAKELPVWESFGSGTRGFGARSLAVIIGEAGDLSAYPKKGHLWKRMGLAVMGSGDGTADVRQGGLRKSACAEDWIAHGYSAKRRSQIYVIGDVLVKQGEYYRQVYLDRKEYERTRAEALGLTVAPAAKIPKKRAAEFISDGHIHKRAQRYMEKRLLKDLWQAWRVAIGSMSKDHYCVAAAEIPGDRKQNGREACEAMPNKAIPPLPSVQPHERKALNPSTRKRSRPKMPTAHLIAAE